MTPGVTVEEDVAPGALDLVGAGCPPHNGCLWGREKGGRGAGMAGCAGSQAPQGHLPTMETKLVALMVPALFSARHT